ncbi:DUF2203 domain-containing protein [Coleofasciculus sp. FACHB-129]|uniref:DUF2203 domain-containing protein n=1 Tax=Cyanophyceae TaxID=3028117 RepID=UPI001682B3ED|nr:DUF2203 domain-containing protein [Coleofasciculus sp. FACHB-129]MBD1896196.1 DUF2203 domain-containing protein [Coleofasciculus sp. FACHB-129]
MPRRPKGSEPSPSPLGDQEQFERSLLEVETSLADLKERYAQVQQDQQRQAELQERLDQIKKEQKLSQQRQLQVELRRIKEELDTIELNLESRLFSWDSLKEPFWQAVRFGGLGIVVGWILKSCAG